MQVRSESWPIRGSFRISRGARTEARVLMVELEQDGLAGRGECVPYARYGESIDSVAQQIETIRKEVEGGLHRADLQAVLPPGAARNAIDCALWDLEAKLTGTSVAALSGFDTLKPVTTAFTISLDAPNAMAKAAAEAADRPLLKLKLGGEGDVERVQAVRALRPDADLIVDANEAWTVDQVEPFSAALAEERVLLIEQPLPADQDEALRGLARPVPLGADESVHARGTLKRLQGLYDVINVKLDKTGGLTEALVMIGEAKPLGFEIMTGCMVSTSLSMAPAFLVAQSSRFVDLDGPLLLAEDRSPGLRYEGALLYPPEPVLWG
ncbi:N-acetyl-D-Glu racemase DgcA [Marinivivus vitaminiproducens]|uniref:N-acetyl-D-Glu racemase DgcA n=1 Tax=Marinivivus vitaminiproducens TaxID=3035935 RepID=UPI00279880FB|nr:dipeptide epimerase [Geminicoccaceae bacterium SCSIO 64248]